MKRALILSAAAALVFAACAKVEKVQTKTEDKPVNFGVYVPQTKAGEAGEMNNAKLQSTGFGVMAYVKAGDYDGSIKANFMYNQEVKYSSSAWSYTPIKYWPNQLTDDGTTDGQGAWSQQAQKVSFFAYAPFVASAGGTEGIIAMTAKDQTGDPKITYKVSDDLDKNVDLVWGTSNGNVWNNVAGGTNTVAEGLPYTNLQKPAIDTKVHFKFYHALAQLNLIAQGSFNIVGVGGDAKDGVKITIKEIELKVPGMYDQGVLNLNNTTAKVPNWDFTSATDTDLTLSISGTKLHNTVIDAGDVAAASQPAGVTNAEGPVLAANKYFTLLPREVSTNVTVKITYYVTTDDTNLDDGYSRVENIIKKTITFPNGFKAGTKNNIKLVLGLSEVALSGEVVDWETGSTIEVFLPKNN